MNINVKVNRKTLTLVKIKTKGALCNEWLHSFPLFQKHVPFQVGIYKILREEYKQKQREFGFRWVRIQLKARVGKAWYRQALNELMPRCQLDGSEVDTNLDYLTGKAPAT